MATTSDKLAEEYSTRILLLRLWTKAVDTPKYDKAEWKELEKRIMKLSKEARHEYK